MNFLFKEWRTASAALEKSKNDPVNCSIFGKNIVSKKVRAKTNKNTLNTVQNTLKLFLH